ncbi:hypothetical protein KEH51_17415 [[Brevibacterium] frigoritolerans]|uniref:Uncharacterized protein n=1 Tax=Peribacillus frigoritolerans TaxID=450367 RepID=A0A941FIF2_9BACI|nr:hypothetical protein [Peribacillus frigoritolerans]
MKKLVTSMALGLLLAFPTISHAEEVPSAPKHTEEEIQQGIEDMENAFEQNELEVDLSDDEGVEKSLRMKVDKKLAQWVSSSRQ